MPDDTRSPPKAHGKADLRVKFILGPDVLMLFKGKSAASSGHAFVKTAPCGFQSRRHSRAYLSVAFPTKFLGPQPVDDWPFC